jgi:hypothetical protein
MLAEGPGPALTDDPLDADLDDHEMETESGARRRWP